MTKIIAVNYDAGKALFSVNDSGVIVDINKRDVEQQNCSVEEALTASSWLKVAPDMNYPAVWRELAEASVTKIEVDEQQAEQKERKFRVPFSVKEEAAQALDWVHGFERGGTPIALSIARTLAHETYISSTKATRIARYFARRPDNVTENAGWSPGDQGYPADERIKYSLWGGDAAREWVSKINSKHPLLATGEVPAGLPSPEEVQSDPAIAQEIEQAPDVEGDGDVDPNSPHEFMADPDLDDQCLVCGRFDDDEMHIPAEEPIIAGAFVYEEECDYFGLGEDPDSTYVSELYKRNADGQWQLYDGAGFVDTEEPTEDTLLIMLDPESAKTLANFLGDRPEGEIIGLELATLNPHESALFFAALPELDLELIDRVFDIYDSQERSVNAKSQVRGPGGKFGDMPDDPESEKAEPEKQTKARLPQPLPLIPDIQARIAQYLADVAKKRGGEPATPVEEDAGGAEDGPIMASYKQELLDMYAGTEFGMQELAEDPGAITDVRPLYLAIVDSVDTEAVLDLISLVPPAAGQQGDVAAWKRDKGQWVLAPEILADLRGVTPPPVVELTDDSILQDVVAQVDKATADGDEPEETPAPGQTPVAQDGTPDGTSPDYNPDQNGKPASAAAIRNGFALPDGQFCIESVADLRTSLASFDTAKNKAFARRHITRRARALNRLDLLPDSWDKNDYTESVSMWGPSGEIMNLVAAGEGGTDRNRGNADKLREYWVRGEGAAKIAWNTPGDWYRCVSHLSKYLGARAKGYCSLRHHEATGHWPGEEENH